MQALLGFDNMVRTLNQGEYSIRISSVLYENEILLITRPSGSGKSTLMRILARLLVPDSGTMKYRGQDRRSIPAVARQRR